MAVITTQTPSLTGVAYTYGAAANGDVFNNDGRTFLHVKNGDASPHDVTITSLVQCNQGFTHHPVVTVAAGVEKIIGPFDSNRFNDGSGQVAVAYSALTSMSVAATHAS